MSVYECADMEECMSCHLGVYVYECADIELCTSVPISTYHPFIQTSSQNGTVHVCECICVCTHMCVRAGGRGYR